MIPTNFPSTSQPNLFKLLSTLLLISTINIQGTQSHGRLMKPPSRSSVWRIPEFASQDPPHNYNDNELFCGAVHQTDDPGTQCGVCGDPSTQHTPRDNEIGGKWYKGIITANYKSGQVIEVEAELTISHKGSMEWRLCADVQTKGETQECFNKHVLKRVVDGTTSPTTKLPVTSTGLYKTKLHLPEGVICSHCILQWNYRSGNNWGTCKNGTTGMGCGPQETFRGCADVSVS